MGLVDTIIIFLILFLPFFIIVILPMMLAYYYGSKSLEKTKGNLNKRIAGILSSKYGIKGVKKRELDKLNLEYMFSFNDVKFSINVSFIERRTYAYYFAKIFGGVPDSIFSKATLNEPPPAILYVVARRKKRLIDKSQKYILALDEVKVGKLNEKFLILSDNPRLALKYFDTELANRIIKLENNITYMIADYKEPHIEIGFEMNDKEINDPKKLISLISLTIYLAKKIKSVKGRGKHSDVLSYVRKILRERE